MDDLHITRCEDCKKPLGITLVLDENGVVNYCPKCGIKRFGKLGIRDWISGIGWVKIRPEKLKAVLKR